MKEVVKSLRKSPAAGPHNTGSFPGVVVLAGDISPADVISHIPVLCEDVNAPYIFVASRAELGAAGVIVGKALYEGTVDLAAALAVG